MAKVNLVALIEYADAHNLDWHDVDVEMFTDHSNDEIEEQERKAEQEALEASDRAELIELIKKLPCNKVRALIGFLQMYIDGYHCIGFDSFWYANDE